MLPYLNANPNTVTVSGHAAGCYMSHRLSINESDTIKGAGLFSCWPYGGAYDGQTSDSVQNMANQSIDLIASNANNNDS